VPARSQVDWSERDRIALARLTRRFAADIIALMGEHDAAPLA